MARAKKPLRQRAQKVPPWPKIVPHIVVVPTNAEPEELRKIREIEDQIMGVPSASWDGNRGRQYLEAFKAGLLSRKALAESFGLTLTEDP